MIHGVDFSQWGGPLSPSAVECWKARGVGFAVVQYSQLMRSHMQVLQDAGLPFEMYVYLYWAGDPASRVEAALAAAQGFPVRRVWLDAEDQESPFDPDKLWEACNVCEEAGIPYGIYTGRWWWESAGHNIDDFADLPLWDANYLTSSTAADPDLVPSLETWKPYGGWLAPTIWQYQGTSDLCGHSVDMNYSFEGEPEPPAPPHEEDFTMNPVWATWKDKPANAPYRTWLLYATPTGLKKDLVESAAQEQAFKNAGIITRKTPKPMTLADLKEYAGSPEPDE